VCALFFLCGTRATTAAFFAATCLVRDNTWRVGRPGLLQDGLTLPRGEFTEFHESSSYDHQRETAANDPDSNFDRKRICDANGMAKKFNKFFHLSFSVRRTYAGSLVAPASELYWPSVQLRACHVRKHASQIKRYELARGLLYSDGARPSLKD